VVLRSATAKIEGLGWEEITASEDLFRRLRAAKAPVPYVEGVWLNDANGDLRLPPSPFPRPAPTPRIATPSSSTASRTTASTLASGSSVTSPVGRAFS
jgi:hypothetical protein